MRQLPLQMKMAFSIGEITRYLREVFESDSILQDIWVQGEVSNLSRPSSGHIYFTLKDSTAALKCVVWKSSAMRIRFPLQNGQLIEAHGYISLYERDGAYQLYADSLKPAGEGLLYQEFMRLKNRLEAEGLFDEERKREIPARPQKIGIVTSPSGAALQDILNTLNQRYRLAEIFISPTSVQGEEAPDEIVKAIRRLNRQIGPDVIILARGGGSLEDLWAFNDEKVVRAIIESQSPVVCGVGHETDFTLADFAADLRAPTPTGAAMMATPDQNELKNNLNELTADLEASIDYCIQTKRQILDSITADLHRASPFFQVQTERQTVDELNQRLERAGIFRLNLHKSTLQSLEKRLETLNPAAVIKRGYAVVCHSDGRLVRLKGDVRQTEILNVRVSDGDFNVEVQ